MMWIMNINLQRLRNHLVFQFYTAFIDLMMGFAALRTKVAPLYAVFMTHYALFDAALQKIVKSAITPLIREADAARDEIFRGMAEFNRAMCKHFDPAKRAAARRMRVVFDTYGDVASKSLNEETSAIYNLLQDLSSEKYAADVEAVGLDNWMSLLRTRNTDFNNLVRQRFQETGEKCDVSLKAEREAIYAAYKNLVKRINALAEVEGDENYKAFIETMNAIVAKYKQKFPHSRNGGGAEEEETGEEGEEGGSEAA